MVRPSENVARPLPRLVTVQVQFQAVLIVVEPPTSLPTLTARSGAVTVTLSAAQALSPSWLTSSLTSSTTLPGSTAQAPPWRGLDSVPIAVGVTGTKTVRLLPGPTETRPLALQVRTFPVMPQTTFGSLLVGSPYEAPVACSSSERIVWPSANVASAPPTFETVRANVNGTPSVAASFVSFVTLSLRFGPGIVAMAAGLRMAAPAMQARATRTARASRAQTAGAVADRAHVAR